MRALNRSNLVKNTRNDLVEAIASGQIQYVGAHFEGRFSSTLSRELRRLGAEWDRTHGWWKVPFRKLPYDLRIAIGTAKSRFEKMNENLLSITHDLNPAKIAESAKLDALFEKTLHKLQKQLRVTTRSVGVLPELTKEEAARIAREYTTNMQLYIQDWTEKEIIELRKNIKMNAFGGYRYEGMVKTIQDRYGVSVNKARFLARQETSLLMVKFKQSRYQSVGANEYKWSCVNGSPKHPVRPMHKRLDGKIFSWNNPPIVDEHGNRKNPGQDYGCRCDAIPIVRFKA